MSRNKTDPFVQSIFQARIKSGYDKGLAGGKWENQKDFGQKLDPAPSEGTVSNWLNGNGIPGPEWQKQLINLFEVSEDYFSLRHTSYAERYEKSSDFITDEAKKHVEFANRRGLSLDLVRALANIVDFNELFPLYSPIGHYTIDPETGKRVYDRDVSFLEPAQINKDIDQDLSFLQIEQRGKTVLLHRCDLAVLKDMQDKIADFVEWLFFERSREMKREVDAVNEFVDGRDLTYEIEKQFDPYAKYYRDQFNFDSAESFDSPEDFHRARNERIRKIEETRNLGKKVVPEARKEGE